MRDQRHKIVSLLWAVTDELALMSFELVEFGEIVAADSGCTDGRTQKRKMQSFDLLSEKAILCARLVALMARALEDESPDILHSLQEAIAEISFPFVQTRLDQALKQGSH